MSTSISPFMDSQLNRLLRDEELLMEVSRESARRQQPEDPDEKLGLDRLATFIDTIRIAEGVTWKEFALSTTPRPFNPVYLMLMSMSLIKRAEITDEVFYALEERLLVPESTLRQMFSVEEVVQQKGLLGSLRVPRIRVSAPFDIFTIVPPASAVGTLGETRDGTPGPEVRESLFEETGFKVRCTVAHNGGLIVEVESFSISGRRVPRNLRVSVISTEEGTVKASVSELDRGVAKFECTDWDPQDRLVIEGGGRG